MANEVENALLGSGGMIGGLLIEKLLRKLLGKDDGSKKEEKIVDEANKDITKEVEDEEAEKSGEGRPKGLTLETISIHGKPKGIFKEEEDDDDDDDNGYGNEFLKTLRKLSSKQTKAAGRL
jgi:hypothetical protein